MLDFFAIFSKSGLVLWCFPATAADVFSSSLNVLIKSVLLQERASMDAFMYNSLAMKYRMDNEFELVYVVCYQKVLQLSYVDKFLDDIQREFRDRYKNELLLGQIGNSFQDFNGMYKETLLRAEEAAKISAKEPKIMRTFGESSKSKKTVASMVEDKSMPKAPLDSGFKRAKAPSTNAAAPSQPAELAHVANETGDSNGGAASYESDVIRKNREKFISKQAAKSSKKTASITTTNGGSPLNKKKQKSDRKWDGQISKQDAQALDYSVTKSPSSHSLTDVDVSDSLNLKGTMKGELADIMVGEDGDDWNEDSDSSSENISQKSTAKEVEQKGKGIFGMFKGLVGAKTLTKDSMAPVLDKMRDHLVAKNVASEIATKLCDSVANSLEGKPVGTFSTISSSVKSALVDACLKILSPKRRVNILRDVLDAKTHGRPYCIAFCGVNGVGKSTNLAKIAFWLIENNCRVLIAACDTFRAGAVEQLRTHCRKLHALHPPEDHGGVQTIELYEKGYGKDPAGVAAEALSYAQSSKFDVCLIDTAGRMQDNEPLMRALAKLVKVNEPDLVLFVGEALVGNEAVDQLVKFNQSLADQSQSDNPHTIDGIVLTKFDTIDDQVGAAVSMTYITGQPIVFVGTGQTYTDLRALSAQAVVGTLLR